ncbi:hypothetical protein CLOP_g15743 [Closterium sp. NIES-67]|nr:hypothetical protein CLOP_g15743 [Closterium sp. NIES-67]
MEASWARRKAAAPSGGPMWLPSTRRPSVRKGIAGGSRCGAGRVADQAAHLSGLWERSRSARAAVKCVKAEVHSAGSPRKEMSSA